MRSMLLSFFASFVAMASAGAAPILVNFDDRAGKPTPVTSGEPVEPQYIVNDEYLPLGVLFGSDGGGIRISAPDNPLSAPNVAGSTAPGPTVSFSRPVVASFWLAGAPAIVDSVALTLTSSSGKSTLSAFNMDGTLIGSMTGSASATLVVNSPARIHSIQIMGTMAFDDFTFDGLAVPELNSLTFVVIAALGYLAWERPIRVANYRQSAH
jgi:hypothetical protein